MKKEATLSYISLVYNNLKYYINVNEINICQHVYIAYDSKSENDNDYSYDHKFNIQKRPFETLEFLNANLFCHPNQSHLNNDETMSEVINTVAVNLNHLEISQYIDVKEESDYYTDLLSAIVNDVDLVIEKMVESLNKDFFHVVAS